jgi:hypothetical protein
LATERFDCNSRSYVSRKKASENKQQFNEFSPFSRLLGEPVFDDRPSRTLFMRIKKNALDSIKADNYKDAQRQLCEALQVSSNGVVSNSKYMLSRFSDVLCPPRVVLKKR